MRRLQVALLASACVLLAAFETARADDRADRERIARQRAEADARFQARRQECEQRFAVTSCVDEARAEHRQAVQRLRGEEGVLDEAQRRQRAAARMAAIEQRQRGEQERASAPRASRESAPMQVKPPRERPAAAARHASAPASAPDHAADEARSRARFEDRQRQAREHREQAQERQAQREKDGKKVAPLPDPAAR